MVLKRILTVSLTVIVLVLVGMFVINFSDEHKVAEINAKRDLSLSAYDQSKAIVERIPELITLDSNDEYQRVKETLGKNLSTSLFNEYFPSDEYQGGKKDLTVSTQSISGEFLGGDEFVFKLELLLEDGRGRDITMLVFVKNNIIYRIQSLG